MTEEPDTAVERLVRSLYRLGLVQRSLARHAFAELGSQGFGALAIASVHGPVRISEIAQKLTIDLSVASRQVAALTAAGYVTREPDPEDRRAQRVSITAEGRRVLRESHRRMVAGLEGVLTDWTEDEITALADGLTRLREDVARSTAPPEESLR